MQLLGARRGEAVLDSMLNALPGLSEVVIESTDASIEELKRRLDERGVDYQGASTRPILLRCYNGRARGLPKTSRKAAASKAIDR